MRDERKIILNLSKRLNKLISFCILILYVTVSALGYEIIRLRDYIDGKFYDRRISSFHFCQWQYLNSTSAIEDEILQLNYRDSAVLYKNRFEIKELFRNNFNYGSAYDEFCKKIHYCGIYYVNFLILI